MSLKPYRRPSLRDKIENLSNEEIKKETERLQTDGKKVELKSKSKKEK